MFLLAIFYFLHNVYATLDGGSPSLGPDICPGLVLEPPAFLSGVTRAVQMACRPPRWANASQVLSVQLLRRPANDSGGDFLLPLATLLTATHSVTLEQHGADLNATANLEEDALSPGNFFLNVEVSFPQENISGQYECHVEVLNSQGVLQQLHSNTETLVSMYEDGSVPLYFQEVLVELRKEIDSFSSDYSALEDTQIIVQGLHNDSLEKLFEISRAKQVVTELRDDVNNGLSAASSRVTAMEAALTRMADVTPDIPVHFYAHLKGYSVTISDGQTIIFDTLEDQSPVNTYSTSTGVFSAPRAGTYYFRAGVMENGGRGGALVASILVNGKPVASLVAEDDYSAAQASASVVVELGVNDEVWVVKTRGRVFGKYPSNSAEGVTYFMGTLLW